MIMGARVKLNFLISAVLSMAIIFFFYSDYLSRHLGNYYLMYSIIWVLSLTMLLLVSLKFMRQLNNLKIGVLGASIGYFSVVIAHFFAVVLDVSNIRNLHMPISLGELAIPLIFPFIVLKGWIFSVLFVTFALLLNRHKEES
jgi:hypothetical protein